MWDRVLQVKLQGAASCCVILASAEQKHLLPQKLVARLADERFGLKELSAANWQPHDPPA